MAFVIGLLVGGLVILVLMSLLFVSNDSTE